MRSFLKRLVLALDMIKFEHSVFALPFALTGGLLAFREDGFATRDKWWKLVLIIVAMVSARSAAMTFNRIIDADVDARNPRTASRHIPAGLLSRRFAWIFMLAGITVFLISARLLNPLCFYLAPLALAVIFFYSYTKRFTSMAHLVLGLALGIAPSAAWIAVRGSLDWRMLLLTASVMLWAAGFDIIYSCQDYEFDQREGLFTLPRRIGVRGALWISRGLHVLMIAALAALVVSFDLGWLAWAGVAATGALLVYEQSIVSADDLSRVNAAFFTVNGYVSVLFFVFWATDIFLLRRGA